MSVWIITYLLCEGKEIILQARDYKLVSTLLFLLILYLMMPVLQAKYIIS